jgi:hypothetical protein
MDRHELEEKNKTDLIAMGAAVGIILTPATSKGDMIDRLLGAPAPEKAREVEIPKEGALRTLDGDLVVSKGKVTVTIMATESEKGDVFLGLNGHGLQIKRGVPVQIPVEYLSCLTDSTIKTVSKDPETGRVTAMEIMRLPFTAVPA